MQEVFGQGESFLFVLEKKNGERICKRILQFKKVEKMQNCVHREAQGDGRRTVRAMPRAHRRDSPSHQRAHTGKHR